MALRRLSGSSFAACHDAVLVCVDEAGRERSAAEVNEIVSGQPRADLCPVPTAVISLLGWATASALAHRPLSGPCRC
jgi:hypothetical protein